MATLLLGAVAILGFITAISVALGDTGEGLGSLLEEKRAEYMAQRVREQLG